MLRSDSSCNRTIVSSAGVSGDRVLLILAKTLFRLNFNLNFLHFEKFATGHLFEASFKNVRVSIRYNVTVNVVYAHSAVDRAINYEK